MTTGAGAMAEEGIARCLRVARSLGPFLKKGNHAAVASFNFGIILPDHAVGTGRKSYMAARLTQLDYDREMAFAVTSFDRPGKADIWAVVRITADPDLEKGKPDAQIGSHQKRRFQDVPLIEFLPGLLEVLPSGGIARYSGFLKHHRHHQQPGRNVSDSGLRRCRCELHDYAYRRRTHRDRRH